MTDQALYLLGAPRLEKDGENIAFDTRKAIALLAYLSVTGGVHGRDSLATLFWAEYDQSSARAALRRTLSVLNKGLEKGILDISRETLGMNPSAPLWVDVVAFEQSLAQTKSHGHPPAEVCTRCLDPLGEAVALYQNDFMAGFTLRDSPGFDDWQFFQTETLRRELSGALQRLAQGLSAQGDFESAILHARRRLALDLLHEPAHRQLMQIYAWAGQASAAARQYKECTRILEEELGVPPMPETTQLNIEIREHSLPAMPGLIDTPAPAAFQPPPAPSLPTPTLPLVGRKQEFHDLERYYTGTGEGGYLMVVEGEAGIGKTRLADEFLSQARLNGVITLTARCYSGEAQLAYAPIIAGLHSALQSNARQDWRSSIDNLWLTEASRLLPELASPGAILAPIGESPGAQARFFEGVSQVLQAVCGSAPPGIVFFDDIHWADEASLDLLTYLVRRMQNRRLFVLLTWRGEEVPPNHRLRQLLAEQQRNNRASFIALTRLDASAVEELVGAVAAGLGAELGGFSQRLFLETEGLPFFIAEYLASISGNDDGDQSTWAMPPGVRDILHSRLDSLDATSQQVMQAAAVIGRSFDFDTLQEASGRGDEETAASLETLVARGLIQEAKPGQGEVERQIMRRLEYDFSHDKIRSLVYLETSQGRRRLLHQRVAETLLRHSHGRKELRQIAGLVAYHYRQAGRAREAADNSLIAGEHARALYANAEAMAHFQSALALGHPEFIALEEAIGDLYTLQGKYKDALTSYASAAAHESAGTLELARLRHKMGDVYHRQGEWEQAEICYRIAAELMTGGDLSRLHADWSRTLRRAGQPERALQMARQALSLAEEAGDEPALAQAHNILGMLLRLPPEIEADKRRAENLDQAIRHLEQSLVLAERLPDPGARIAALNNLSQAYAEHGELERALESANAALDLCTRLGDRHRQAAIHSNLADLYHSARMESPSMAHQKQAAIILGEIGASDSGRPRPEIWKLTEW